MQISSVPHDDEHHNPDQFQRYHSIPFVQRLQPDLPKESTSENKKQASPADLESSEDVRMQIVSKVEHGGIPSLPHDDEHQYDEKDNPDRFQRYHSIPFVQRLQPGRLKESTPKNKKQVSPADFESSEDVIRWCRINHKDHVCTYKHVQMYQVWSRIQAILVFETTFGLPPACILTLEDLHQCIRNNINPVSDTEEMIVDTWKSLRHTNANKERALYIREIGPIIEDRRSIPWGKRLSTGFIDLLGYYVDMGRERDEQAWSNEHANWVKDGEG
jgi:hypothetical protein